MKSFARYVIASCLLCVTVSAFAGVLAVGVPQSFSFSAPDSCSDKPITVYYYKPRNATADAKVLFAIHGVERKGSRARDNWIDAAEKYGVIVLAPEFNNVCFPSRLFQMGGIEEKNLADRPFQIIEKLFDKVRADEHLTTQTYSIFGHSAGGQFVHRYALMMSRPRMDIAIAANAGTYTFPNYSASLHGRRFPWTLDESHMGREDLKERFSRHLIILLGEGDVKKSHHFPGSAEAMAQGSTRLERGKNFCAAAAAQARELETNLQWRCITVPGVGHNSAKMSRAAVNILFEGRNP